MIYKNACQHTVTAHGTQHGKGIAEAFAARPTRPQAGPQSVRVRHEAAPAHSASRQQQHVEIGSTGLEASSFRHARHQCPETIPVVLSLM